MVSHTPMQPIPAGRMSQLLDYLRRNGRGAGVELLVNFVAPFVLYNYLRKPLGDAGALMASSAPPIAWSVIEFVRRRRVDALSLLVICGIVLSLLAFLGGGGVKFLQLRERLVTGVIGLIFLGSAAIGRPLIYQLARATIGRRTPGELAGFEAMRDDAGFQRVMMLMTIVWGAGLVLDSALSCALVFVLTIRQWLVVGPMLGYGFMGSLSLWTFYYGRRRRRLGAARMAAAAAAASAAAPATPQEP